MTEQLEQVDQADIFLVEGPMNSQVFMKNTQTWIHNLCNRACSNKRAKTNDIYKNLSVHKQNK